MDRGYVHPQTYVDYYVHQAGNGLPGFQGAPTMYGSGLGGLFKGLFRMAVPFLKRGFAIAKPHLKTAAKGFVSDVFNNIMSKTQAQNQDGSGLALTARKKSKRLPGRRHVVPNKRRKVTKIKNSVKKTEQRGNRHPYISHKRNRLNIF